MGIGIISSSSLATTFYMILTFPLRVKAIWKTKIVYLILAQSLLFPLFPLPTPPPPNPLSAFCFGNALLVIPFCCQLTFLYAQEDNLLAVASVSFSEDFPYTLAECWVKTVSGLMLCLKQFFLYYILIKIFFFFFVLYGGMVSNILNILY